MGLGFGKRPDILLLAELAGSPHEDGAVRLSHYLLEKRESSREWAAHGGGLTERAPNTPVLLLNDIHTYMHICKDTC